MLLAVDVGNTQTVFGLFDGERLTEQFRVGTDRTHTGDELAVMLRAFVELDALDGIVLSSVVPELQREYELLAERWSGAELLVLGPGVSTGIPVLNVDPREVGPDRIANAVAARERYGAPSIVVDFGTSTNFDVVEVEQPVGQDEQLVGRAAPLRRDAVVRAQLVAVEQPEDGLRVARVDREQH